MTILFIILSAAAVLLPLLVRPVYYMVADDYLLNYIANGSYGRETSAHLVFIKTALGRLLKMLYGLTPAVNWYMALLALLLIISFAVIMCVLYRRTGSLFCALIPLLAEVFIVPYFFTFTVTAFFTAAAAGALLSCDLEAPGRKWPALIGSLILFGTSFALRKDSFLAGTALIAPVMLDAAVTGQRLCAGDFHFPKIAAGVLKKALIPFLGFVLVTGAVEALDRYDYRTPAWQEYIRYNRTRGDVVDYVLPPYRFMEEILEEEGLTKTDYNMLAGWKFCELDLFSVERLERLSARTHEFVTDDYRMNYMKTILTPYNIMLAVVPLLLLLLLLVKKPDAHKLSQFLILGFDVLLLYLLSWDLMRYVHRVAMPLAAVSAFAMLLCERSDENGAGVQTVGANAAGAEDGKALRGRNGAAGAGEDGKGEQSGSGTAGAGKVLKIGICAALTAVILIFSGIYLKNYLKTNYYAFRALSVKNAGEIRAELRAHPDRLYIIDAGLLSDLYYYDMPVQKLLYTDDFRNVIRSGSWDSYSPRYYGQAEQYVRDPDNLLSSLIEEDCVRFVTTDSRGMKEFLEERSGGKVEKERDVFYEEPGIGIIRFSN